MQDNSKHRKILHPMIPLLFSEIQRSGNLAGFDIYFHNNERFYI